MALSTQWRIGPEGRLIGLDYSAMFATAQMLHVDRAEWPDLFVDVRVMEHEVLSEQRKRNG